MYRVTIPHWFRLLMPASLHWEVPTNKRTLYLTFDDGPTAYLSHEILAILRDFEAKATFFCVGENAAAHPHILERYRAEGHQTGNHTFNHLEGWKTPTKEYIRNVQKASGVLNTPFLRPPYGKIKYNQIRSLSQDYMIIMWSVLTGDFDPNISKQQCLQNGVEHAKRGSIVVFHDNEKARDKVLFALPRFIRHFYDQGYRMEALEEGLFGK
ncbi:MAG: polysaccharide deacetylase family protein [Bacteroidales bacterium]|nr:polysaccharide deacetylase family protein [Bacteroidales bacterium]